MNKIRNRLKVEEMKRVPHFSRVTADIVVTAIMAAMVVIELALPNDAQGAAPHVHGVAVLEIAQDGAMVQINLNSPLDNLLGFERAPRNEKERQTVRTVASKLHQAGNLFIFTPAAQCRLGAVRLESPLLPSELLMPHSSSGSDKSKGTEYDKDDRSSASSPLPRGSTSSASMPSATAPVGEHTEDHAELEATWNFRCAAPQALQDIDVRLFDAFPGLRRLDAMIVGPKGQSGAKLSPASTRLKW
jgi:Protein of unknown function (DUF2796)